MKARHGAEAPPRGNRGARSRSPAARVARMLVRYVCLRCGCSIDSGGMCGFGCEVDTTPPVERPLGSVGMAKYRLGSVKVWNPAKKKK